MKPNDYEIEQAGNALISLTEMDYTAEQLSAISAFLKGNALDLNDAQMNKLFSNQTKALDAIRLLHDFAFQFQNEEDIIDDFQVELENVMLSINDDGKQGRASV